MNTEEAVEALAEALSAVQLKPLPVAPTQSADLLIDVDGRVLTIEVKHYSLIDVPRAMQLCQGATSPGPLDAEILVLIGDRIVEGARALLREAGQSWFDLRGHLFLRTPGVRIDVATERFSDPVAKPAALTGRVALATAVDLLLNPSSSLAVRETARRIGAAPSTVSQAVKALRDEGLVDDRNRVDTHELFWETSRRWRPQWVPVERYPHPDDALRNPALRLGLEDPHNVGWALSVDVAAAHLGAPIALRTDAPIDLYVPTSRAHRLAVSLLEENRTLVAPAARLAVPPVAAACEERVDVAGWRNEHWFLARTIFVALDLAGDPGRGAEILSDWQPTAGGHRVW
jgi:DNA-binding transcriptional ArsR family regulator